MPFTACSRAAGPDADPTGAAVVHSVAVEFPWILEPVRKMLPPLPFPAVDWPPFVDGIFSGAPIVALAELTRQVTGGAVGPEAKSMGRKEVVKTQLPPGTAAAELGAKIRQAWLQRLEYFRDESPVKSSEIFICCPRSKHNQELKYQFPVGWTLRSPVRSC